MKKLKVWGGRYFGTFPPKYPNLTTFRLLVAAYTKKQAMEIAKITHSEFTNFFNETGNALELALANEVGVWVVDSIHKTVIERKV